jgi:hypothetical protein
MVRHGLTNLHSSGPRWFKRASVISRLFTIDDRMREFPGRITGSSQEALPERQAREERLARRLRFLIRLPHDAISHHAPRPACERS